MEDSAGQGSSPVTSFDPDVILRSSPWLNRVPYLTPAHAPELPYVVDQLTALGASDFTWASDFSPKFLVALMRHGFLPMATEVGRGGLVALLPKFHTERCIVKLADLKIQRGTRKKAKHYRFTTNSAFDAVIDGLRKQHGSNCWLYPPLVASLKAIATNPGAYDDVGNSGPVRVHSLEIWEAVDKEAVPTEGGSSSNDSNDSNCVRDGYRLVAGEVGYSVGLLYTSLSGFCSSSSSSSSGSVQMACTGALLAARGATMWDLGMDMPYKRAMGASLFQRPDFTQLVTAARASTTPLVFLPHDHHSEKSEDSASGAHLHPSNSDMDSNHPEMGVSADATIRAFFATPSPGASQAKSSPTEAAAAAAKGAKGKNSGDGGGECLGKGSSEKRRSPSDEDGSGGCAQCGATVANQQGSSSAPNTRLSACARCKKVYYCGRTCQAAHWKAGHKKACVLAES